MPSLDFWTYSEVDSPWGPETALTLNVELVEDLRAGPLPETSDVLAAQALLDLVWDELQVFGTGGGEKCNDKEIAIAIRALEAVTRRLGVPLELPFRDFSKFRSYWLRTEGYGSWQARRDILEGLFAPTRKELETLESRLAGPKLEEPLISSLRHPAAIRDQLGRLQRTAQSDPALAIGTAKEHVESTAKTVLLELGEEVDDKDDLPTLIGQAQKALGLHPKSLNQGPDSTEAVKRILGGLLNITAGLGELRNRGYGTGHGQKGERVGLRPRHARLAVNAAMTWCSIVLDTLQDPEAPWRQIRPPPKARHAARLTCRAQRTRSPRSAFGGARSLANPAPPAPSWILRARRVRPRRSSPAVGCGDSRRSSKLIIAWPRSSPRCGAGRPRRLLAPRGERADQRVRDLPRTAATVHFL